MSDFYPEGVSTLGNETVIFVPALADPEAPTVEELTAETAIYLSCALRGFSSSAEQSSVSDVRLCSKEQYESPGRTTVTIDDLTYVYDPQAAGKDQPDNIHYDTLKEGVTGYLIDRRGLDAREDPIEDGQIVDVYPVEMGAQRRVAVDPSGDEGSKFEIIQKAFVTGPPAWDATVGGESS